MNMNKHNLTPSNGLPNIRIGQGYDLHALVAGDGDGDGIWLGGILIPCDKKTLAHSDGDVLLHAICDALLGACNIRGAEDIGAMFPDTDDNWKDVASSVLIKQCMEVLQANNYQVVNIDSTIVLERPLLADYKPQMRNNIAQLLGIDEDAVSIKATRGEGLDAIGRGEALAVHCVCLICKHKV